MKIKGVDSVLKNLESYINKFNSTTIESLNTIGEDLKAKSVPLAPIDTAELRKSCKVTPATVKNFTVRVGYYVQSPFTGERYALKQHENLTYNHPRGGQAKYLEQPMKENAGIYKNMLAGKLRRVK